MQGIVVWLHFGQVGAESRAREGAKLDVQLDQKPKVDAAVARSVAGVKKEINQGVQKDKLDAALTSYNILINSDLDKIYGRGEGVFPDILRSQDGIDLMAERDRMIGMLKLGARGELKGTGPITEGEQKIVSDAVTVLANPNISAERARIALDEAMTTLNKSAGVSEETIDLTLPNGIKVKRVQ